MTEHDSRIGGVLAAVAAVSGIAVVAGVWMLQATPGPWWLLALMAAAFAGLEFWSVEINDRLYVSSSIMVAFAAAVVFGRHSAVLAVALMASVAVLQPVDFRLRRWREPAFNFGQLVVSNVVGVLILVPFLPEGPVVRADLPQVALGASVAAVVCNTVNFSFVAGYARLVYADRVLLPWSRMLANHASHAVLGAYGAVLGASYVIVGPVTLPLMVITFLVGHVGFASYSRMRRAHEDTVGGFVKAIEALDPHTKGHTDRVTDFCRLTGEALGMDADELETLRWAAQIHDVGKLAAPPDLLRSDGPLPTADRDRLARRASIVENLLADVDFLAPAVRAISGGAGQQSLIARIVSAADAFDAMTSTRSYRAAIPQSTAFTRLRDETDRYGPEVVEALIESIESSGSVYGAPDAAASAVVESLVAERTRRA